MVMASKTTQRGTEFNSQDPFLLDTLWLPHLHCGICVSHTKEIKYKKKKKDKKKERKKEKVSARKPFAKWIMKISSSRVRKAKNIKIILSLQGFFAINQSLFKILYKSLYPKQRLWVKQVK